MNKTLKKIYYKLLYWHQPLARLLLLTILIKYG